MESGQTATRPRVRCRAIGAADLAHVTDLLCEGFGGRPRSYWDRGLAIMAERPVPEGAPRFGYCLDAGGKLAGAILVIAASRLVEGQPRPFANVASWYVGQDYRAYAHMLAAMALRNRDTTYINVSPAPATWPIVESQGYTRYCSGLFFAAAAGKRKAAGVDLVAVPPHGAGAVLRGMAEDELLRRHAGYGCEVLVAVEGARRSGFVFRPFRMRSGSLWTPAMQVIHAPDHDCLMRLAGNIGRHFLKRGAPLLALDADGPLEGLAGIYTARRGRKYFKGPRRPGLNDMADTEFAIFGI